MSEYDNERIKELERSVRTLATLLVPLARGRKVSGQVANVSPFQWVEGAIAGVRNGNVLVKSGVEESVEVSVENLNVQD